MKHVWILAGTIGWAACSGNGGAGGPTEPLLDELPRPLSPAELQVVDAANGFTFRLFRQAVQGLPADSNAVLSPLSASMALGMALNGARDETYDAMRATLGFQSPTIGEIDQGYRDVTTLLLGLDRLTRLDIANAIWVRGGVPVESAFIQAGQTFFNAEVDTLDFASPGAPAAINDWVKRRTQGRIRALVERIEPNEIMFLVNAVYFKGQWRFRFDPEKTQPAPFHGADGQDRQVPMMHLDEKIGIHATPAYQAADLLYGNGAFAMTILLPAQGSTPADLLATLTPADWRTLTDQLVEEKVPLSLPRFTIEYARALVPDLRALGMGIAFDPARADFSGIADVKPEGLYLTRVEQKAFVEVNEEGTEAAAATSVGVGVTSAPMPIVVDRPFLFVIRERFSGTILFVGQVNVPGATG